MRLGLMLTMLVPAAVGAQAASPSVAVFPLEVTRPANLSAKQRDELQGAFRAVLRRAGALLPDGAKQNAALLELKRADCDRHDECLAQLARLSGTLYAVFASVDLTAEGNVVAFGRVVRDDGRLVAEVGRDDQVKMVKGKDSFVNVAPIALTRLVEQLKVAQLPLAKAVETPVVTPPPAPKEIVPPPPPPPALPVVDEAALRRGAGKGLLLGGAGVAVVGGVLFAVGQGVGASLTPQAGELPRAQLDAFQTARSLTLAGAIALGTGAVAAGVGAVLWATAPSVPSVTASAVPVPGGAVLSLQGEF